MNLYCYELRSLRFIPRIPWIPWIPSCKVPARESNMILSMRVGGFMRRATSQWLLGLFLYAGCMQSPSASNNSFPALSAEKAMEHVRAQVVLRPRPPGAATLTHCRESIVLHLKEYGHSVEEDKVESTT